MFATSLPLTHIFFLKKTEEWYFVRRHVCLCEAISKFSEERSANKASFLVNVAGLCPSATPHTHMQACKQEQLVTSQKWIAAKSQCCACCLCMRCMSTDGFADGTTRVEFGKARTWYLCTFAVFRALKQLLERKSTSEAVTMYSA